MHAEENARSANLRAADAELESSLTHKLDDPPALLTDEETGLPGEGYFLATVAQRISAARRHLRPVAVGLIDVIVDQSTEPTAKIEPTVVSLALADTLRGADTACRLDDGRFAVILEDAPENGTHLDDRETPPPGRRSRPAIDTVGRRRLLPRPRVRQHRNPRPGRTTTDRGLRLAPEPYRSRRVPLSPLRPEPSVGY
jgi:GGDEF domain-containing protein